MSEDFEVDNLGIRQFWSSLYHSKIENSYLEKNSCKILILSNTLLKIRKARENIRIKN
jgi:hypothetical protein